MDECGQELGLTFISKHSNRNGQEGTQHVKQSYGGLQRPFILTFSALGALLDPCVRKKRTLHEAEDFVSLLRIKQTCGQNLMLSRGWPWRPGVPHLDKQPWSLH